MADDQDRNVWHIDDEYFFGSEYLVAPIFESMAKSRAVYLPEGYKWRDCFSDAVYEGGCWKEISSDNYIVVLKKA